MKWSQSLSIYYRNCTASRILNIAPIGITILISQMKGRSTRYEGSHHAHFSIFLFRSQSRLRNQFSQPPPPPKKKQLKLILRILDRTTCEDLVESINRV
jgi:hypothetical protein